MNPTCLFINTAAFLLLLIAIIATPSALAAAAGDHHYSSSSSVNERKLQDDNDQQQALFDQAFAKWTSITNSFQQDGIMVDYNFAYIQNDEGLPRFQAKVRNSTDYSLDFLYPLRLDEMYFTIDELMGYISESLSTLGKDVSVTYDETYGYPTTWKVDLVNQNNDDNDEATGTLPDVPSVIGMTPPETLQGKMASFTFFSVLQRELEKGKAMWNSLGIDSYDYTVQLIGFLPPEFTMPMHVDVRNGVIKGIFYEETGEMADMSKINLPTIEKAFETIEYALNNYAAANVYASFDETLGYPSQYFLEDSIWIADGGPTTRISNVVALANAGNGTVDDGQKDDPKDEWDAAKLTWETKALTNYRFGILKQCECSFTEHIAIQVNNGEVIQMTNRFGEKVYENVTGYSLTIEDIFDLIKDGMDSKFDTVDVTYDEEYGYPKTVVLDPSLKVADDEYTLTIDYLAPLSEWQSDLDAAQTLWQAQNLSSSYNYTYQRSCECPPEYQKPKLVQIVDGTVVAIDGGPVMVTPPSTSLSAPTLDGLFAIIQEAINANVFGIWVKYDEQYGYPTSIVIDYDEMIVDEEFIVTAKLEELKGSGGKGVLGPGTFASAKLTWESKALTNYRFGILKQCECIFNEAIAIQVNNGAVIQMTNRYGEKVYENVTGYSLTIEDIFDLIENGMDSNFSAVDVTYDEEYGYPKTVVLDPSEMVADDEYSLTVDYLAPLTEWQSDLDAGKTLWQAQNLSSYSYTYQLQFCGECPPAFKKPKLVQVVDGIVVAINGGPPSSTLSIDEVPTLDGLFANIQKAINTNAFQIRVTYDEQYGYPTSIFIDSEEMMVDDEISVTAKLEEVDGDDDGGLVDPEAAWSAAKLTWETHGLANYHFGIFRQCRCVFTERLVMQVSNGEVIQMRNRFGEEVDENVTGYSLTIEDIFDRIKDGMDSNFDTVDVTYDEEYGYPKTVVLDPRLMVGDDEYTLTIDYLAPLTEWQGDLEAGKTLWQAQNLSSYNYTYQRSCECPPEYQKPKLVQVVDGMMVAIDGIPVQAKQRSSSLSLDEAPTFDKLFAIIQDAINANVFGIWVKYDEQYGYPTSIVIDYDEMIADEEFVVTAKLEGIKGNVGKGVVDPGPFSSAPKLALTVGQSGLAFILLCAAW